MSSGGGREQCQKAFGTALFHEPLLTASPDGIVLVRDISFASLSQDTLLPFHGKVNVAYVPQHGVVLGLSKLARATRYLSGKVQRVEQLAADLMAAIQQEVSPKGVFVTVQATLLGYGAEPAMKETSAACGCFAKEGSGLCDEVRLLLGRGTSGRYPTSFASGINTNGVVDTTSPLSIANSAAATTTTTAAAAITTTAGPAADGEAVLAEAPISMISAVEALLRGIGEDPYKESLKGSAERYIRWLQGATAGYSMKVPTGCCTCCSTTTDSTSIHGVSGGISCTVLVVGEATPTTAAGGVIESSSLQNIAGRAVAGGVSLGPATPDNLSSDTSSDDAQSTVEGGGSGVAGAEGPCYVSLREQRGPPPTAAAAVTATVDPAAVDPASLSVLSIRFTSQCEHHLLPFYGTIKIGYTISSTACSATQAAALSQIVEVFSRRLQVQERLTQQIADAAAAVVGPEQDVLVLCESAHMCMVARGVEEHASATLTTGARGLFAENAVARSKALQILLQTEGL
jgi:GTP cyclohydrolase I